MIQLVCQEYYKELEEIVEKIFPKKDFNILITGATGLIGSCMVDTVIYANEKLGRNIELYAASRSLERLQDRFDVYQKRTYFHSIVQDVIDPLNDFIELDYIVGAASNADPATYRAYPVETISANVLGVYRLLEYGKRHPKVNLLFTSTNEVYGMMEKKSPLVETDYGSIDYNVIRNGYPESKRVAELLIRSGGDEYGIHGIIARLGLVYGPTMTRTDNKVVAQFIRAAIDRKDIILKSSGRTKRTYCYVTDAVSGLFLALFNGQSGEAYNIANDDEIISIRHLAQTAADIGKTQVKVELPADYREEDQPKDKILSASKLRGMGWRPKYSIREGLRTTLNILEYK